MAPRTKEPPRRRKRNRNQRPKGGNKPHKTNLKIGGVSDSYAKFVVLVASATKLSPKVLAAWCLAEGGPDDNPLNIGPGNHYGSIEGGAKATVDLLRSSTYSGIMATVGKSDREQIHAIAQSPWCPGCPGYEALLLGTYGRVSVTGWNAQAGIDAIKHDAGWSTETGVPGVDQIDDTVEGLKAIAGAMQDIVKFLVRLVSPEFLQRFGKIIVGAVALLVGAVLLGRAGLGVDAAMTDTVRRGRASRRRDREYRKQTQREAERAHTVAAARRQGKNPRPKPSRIKAPKPGVQKGGRVSPQTPLSKVASDEPPF